MTGGIIAHGPSQTSGNILQTLFNTLRANKLQWIPELDLGFYPVVEQPYNHDYWERYRLMDKTIVGAKLTKMRVELVRKYVSTRVPVLDIGIGGGRFVDECFNSQGFDINPEAVAWLTNRKIYRDPYASARVDSMSFWDSLEHIHDPLPLLAKITGHVFVSLPIFTGPEHVLQSKHFRRDEHCWYFTTIGFVNFMNDAGFDCLERNTMEQDAGREGIETFVFLRKVKE
jgi:hypothetical protein